MNESTINITVLLFGACREAVGLSECSCSVAAPADAARAWMELKRQYPPLEAFERSALFAINEEHVSLRQPLREGDTLAIFPPVSGG